MGEESTGEDDGNVAVSVRATGDRSLPREILEFDHVYEALANRRRRYVCYSLLEDAQQSLTELATDVAAWENDVPEGAVTHRQHERAYVSLYHTHIPKLVDLGVVSFDAASETVTSAANAEQVTAALIGVGAALDSQQNANGETNAEN